MVAKLKDPDYDAFFKTLPHIAIVANNRDMVTEFRRKYREETTTIISMMQRIGLIGHLTSLHPDPPITCDLCSVELEKRMWFVDGETADETSTVAGAWANMCPKCFFENGHSLGWGRGQFYVKVGNGYWRLIAGGDPSELEADPS